MTDEQMKARIAELEAELEAFKKHHDTLIHQVICCGVAATHPDAALTTRGAYANEWNSRQAESVRKLRAERDALKVDAERRKTALMIAREGYAGERATGLPVLEEWRERTIAIIDAAMKEPGQ